MRLPSSHTTVRTIPYTAVHETCNTLLRSTYTPRFSIQLFGAPHPKIEMDPARLSSVKARATILRDYLAKGGNLYIVYPKGGFSRLTEKQQKIYKQELANYPNHLFDVPLNQDPIPEDLIGATYFFKTR